MKVSITIRKANEKDINFIRNSWVKSYEKEMVDVPTSVYNKNQNRICGVIMTSAECFVAVNPEDEYQIYGYVVYETMKEIAIMHYIYVKHPYRRLGIGRALCDMIPRDAAYPMIASHKTLYYDYVFYKWNLTYNPYVLYKGIL